MLFLMDWHANKMQALKPGKNFVQNCSLLVLFNQGKILYKIVPAHWFCLDSQCLYINHKQMQKYWEKCNYHDLIPLHMIKKKITRIGVQQKIYY